MKKNKLMLAFACAAMIGASAFASMPKPAPVYADESSEEPISSEIVSSEEQESVSSESDVVSSEEEQSAVSSEEEQPVVSSEEEPVVEHKATVSYKVYHIDEESGEKVEDQNNKYGDVIFSSIEANAGDEVVAVIQGNPVMDMKGKTVSLFRYLVKSVTVNGVPVQPSNEEKGEYTFILVEGANLFEVSFSGRAEISVVDLATMNWSSLFTVDNLLRLIVLAVLVFVSSGFFITLLKKGKIESITKEEFAGQAQKVVNAAVKDFLENDVKELLAKQTLLSQEAVDTAQVLMRVTLLAQENTPEARLEIIKELQKYKSTDMELAAKIQEILDGSIKKRDELEVAKKEAIEEAKKAIDDLAPIEVDKEDDDRGGFGTL